jgi:ribosomal protein S24E
MEIEIIDEKDNVFFKRKELKVRLKHSKTSTPSKQELAKELAAKYNTEEDCVVIDYIFTKKGLGESEAKVKVYKEKPKVEKAKEEVKEVEAQTSEAK